MPGHHWLYHLKSIQFTGHKVSTTTKHIPIVKSLFSLSVCDSKYDFCKPFLPAYMLKVYGRQIFFLQFFLITIFIEPFLNFPNQWKNMTKPEKKPSWKSASFSNWNGLMSRIFGVIAGCILQCLCIYIEITLLEIVGSDRRNLQSFWITL